MDNSILEMIDQIDQESFIAEMDVVTSLSDAYVKDIIMEASTNDNENPSFGKRFIEKAKKVLQKIKEFFQIIINQIRKFVLRTRYNRILKKAKKDNLHQIFRPLGYDVVMNDIKDLTTEVSSLIKRNPETPNKVSFSPTDLERVAKIFKKVSATAGHYSGRELSLINAILHPQKTEETIKKNYIKLIDHNRDMISISAFEKYIETSTSFCDEVLELSKMMLLSIDRAINAIKERNERLEKGDVDTSEINEDEGIINFAVINPDKLASFTSDLLKCVSTFMKLELDNIHVLSVIVNDSDFRRSSESIRENNGELAKMISQIKRMIKQSNSAIDKDQIMKNVRKNLKEKYPDLTDHDIDEMLRDIDLDDLFGGDDDT